MKKFYLSLGLILLGLPAYAGNAVLTPAQKPAPPAKAAQKISENTRLTHIGEMKTHKTVYEDTFIQIARDNNLGFVELRAANPDVDPWMPGTGVEMILPTMHLLPDAPQKGIVINLPAMRLYHFRPGQEPASYAIGIGREGLLTPTGATTIRAKKEGPTWRPTPRMRSEDPTLPESVPPGPENPLGTHILYLSWPEYGIHGTNKPYGIGRRVSSGCIRMYPEGILALYPAAKEGEMVTVVNQPVKAAWIEDKLYLEAHPTMKQADVMEIDGGLPSYEISKPEMEVILRAAGSYRSAVDWQKVRHVIRERRGYPVVIAEKPVVATKVPDESAGPS